ncbi:DNA-methyltransferase [Alkaliphilus peptidifermentans]|uniref:Methyltransferase n=1 Tax=Alkaliphilus peptidifermentans DSM 18978 TaxID=1120976 RepID=A0A1G5ECI4_9FIRM|nr:site-specific DNA-methyltransferase [Alkaliphilus peptidifermentans]SCY24714.1 DNA modification methylase [Alkaliphilus peptidifermentans DSM 18978]
MGVYEGEFGLNKWKVYQGDCLAVLNSEIDDDSIDCIVTSPPYWERRAYGQRGGTDGNIGKWKYANKGKLMKGEIGNGCSYEKYINDIGEVIKLMYKKLKKNKFAFVNISTWHKNSELIDASHDIIRIAKDVGFNHWDTIIWIKRNPMPSGRYKEKYLSSGWEYVLAFTKGKGFAVEADNFQPGNSHFICKNCGDDNWLDFKNATNYFYSNIGCFGRKRKPMKSHPALFPIELPTYCLSIATKKNDIVLDPFAGSGTTLIAGLNLGLNVIGCELIPDIYSGLVEELISLK